MRIAQYGEASRHDLVAELVVQVDFLCAEHTRLAGHLADHQRVYWDAFEHSDGASVSARQQDAAHAALADWVAVLETRGEINACAVKVDLLRLLLGSDTRVSQRDTFPPDKTLTP